MDGKCGALAWRAVDRQAAAMPVEDVFDKRKPKPSPTLRPALADIDAIKALGQPGQMLGRDTRTIVAHAHLRFGFAVGRGAKADFDIDTPTGGAIFERVFDQIFEHPDKFVVIA